MAESVQITRRKQPMRVLLVVLGFALLSPLSARAGELEDVATVVRAGDLVAAWPLLRSAVQHYPQYPELKGWLAESYLAVAQAQLHRREFLAAATTLATGRSEAGAEADSRFWQLRGHAFYAAGALADAEMELRQALILDRSSVATLGLLARVHYDRGELYESELLLNDACALAPNDAQLEEARRKVQRERAFEERLDSSISGTFTVTFDGTVNAGLGAAVRTVLEQAYNEIGVQFNQFPAGPFPVILYGNADFLALTGAPDWSGGLYDGKIRLPVGGLTAMTPTVRTVLYHEYVHLLIGQRTGRRVPRWLNEGLAEVVSRSLNHADDDLVSPVLLLPLAQLDQTLTSGNTQEVGSAYRQTRLLTAYLLERCGWSAMLQLLDELAVGSQQVAAARLEQGLCGTELTVLVEEWRTTMGEQLAGSGQKNAP